MTGRRPVAAGLLVVAGLGTTGCSPQETQDVAPSPVVDTVPDGAGTTSEGPSVQVRTLDEGGIVLVTTTTVLEGGSSPVNGQLVTGPGGCLALDRQGPPVLLVLPHGSELRTGERPSVSWGEVTVEVGGPLRLDAVSVPVERLDGLPDGCGEGAAQEALVVGVGD
ncbi:hypothetical protein ACQE98_13760 [Ornithinimicrobium sp. W1679]|uniref:hypothetical protein n=1 Tax=Ornithinimicrobium sp. W1679 TaxID=3418770 RepID=UPI003CF49562